MSTYANGPELIPDLSRTIEAAEEAARQAALDRITKERVQLECFLAQAEIDFFDKNPEQFFADAMTQLSNHGGVDCGDFIAWEMLATFEACFRKRLTDECAICHQIEGRHKGEGMRCLSPLDEGPIYLLTRFSRTRPCPATVNNTLDECGGSECGRPTKGDFCKEHEQ